MSVSRRRFLAASASLPFGLYLSAHAYQASQPKFGDKREDFDAWFGHGTESGSFISYTPLSAGRASYYVAYDEEGNSETIVGDFNHLASGGIEFDANEIGQSQYIPADAVAGPVFNLGGLSGGYGLRSWHSSEVASNTGGSGTIVILDRFVRESYALAHFKETMITTEAAEVNPIEPTGEHIGPHSTEDEWKAYPGGVGMAQTGMTINTPPVPGEWDVQYSTNVRANLEPALPVQQAAQLIATMLPPSELEWTAWFGYSPITDTQIRLHQFRAHDTERQFLSMQFVDGDEQTGTVTSFRLWNALG